MQRWVIRCAVGLIAVGAVAPAVSFAAPGPHLDQSRTVESTVREVNKTWQKVYLTDGTVLSTNDVKLLEQLTPGMRIRAAFEERAGGQNFINRVEIVP